MSQFGKCQVAQTGEEAIAAFEKAWQNWQPFDVIMLDIILADMDGKDVLVDIRKLEENKQMPKDEGVKIIMVSSHSSKDQVLDCFKLGANGFIVKPADSKIIQSKLEDIGLEVKKCPAPDGAHPEP